MEQGPWVVRLPQGELLVEELVSGLLWAGFAVAGHDPVAEDLVRVLNGLDVDDEFLLRRVLRHQFQTELKILEARCAKISNGLRFGKGFVSEHLDCGLGEADLHPVLFLEAAGELLDELPGHEAFLLFGVGQDRR